MHVPILLRLPLRPRSNASSSGMSNVEGRSGSELRAPPGVRSCPLSCDGGSCLSGDNKGCCVFSEGEGGCGAAGGSMEMSTSACCDAACGGSSGGGAKPKEKPKFTSLILRVLIHDLHCQLSVVFFNRSRGKTSAYPAPRCRICSRSSRSAGFISLKIDSTASLGVHTGGHNREAAPRRAQRANLREI